MSKGFGNIPEYVFHPLSCSFQLECFMLGADYLER